MASPVDLAIRISSDASDAAADFDKTGAAALGMADDVDRASRTADAAGDRMGRAADGADELGSKSAQAAGGLGDLGGALALMPGPLGALGTGMEAVAPAIQGVTGAADLANLAFAQSIVTTTRDRIGKAAHAVTSKAQAVATKTATIAQRGLNLAMRANPIGIVVTAVVALVAIVVIAYKRSETFRRIVDKAFAVAKRVVLAAGRAFGDFKDAVIRKGGEALRWITGLPGRIGRGLSSLGRTLAAAAVAGFVRFQSAASDRADRLVSWVTRLPGRIARGVGSLGTLLYRQGVNVVEGLWAGIRAMGGWIRDRIIGFVKAVLPGPVERVLGISSPSKVMARIGGYAAEGMAIGIEDGASRVARASQRLAEAAQPDLDLASRTRTQIEAARRVLAGARLPQLAPGLVGQAGAGAAAAAAPMRGGDTVNINMAGLVGNKVELANYLVPVLTDHFRRNGIRVVWGGNR